MRLIVPIVRGGKPTQAEGPPGLPFGTAAEQGQFGQGGKAHHGRAEHGRTRPGALAGRADRRAGPVAEVAKSARLSQGPGRTVHDAFDLVPTAVSGRPQSTGEGFGEGMGAWGKVAWAMGASPVWKHPFCTAFRRPP